QLDFAGPAGKRKDDCQRSIRRCRNGATKKAGTASRWNRRCQAQRGVSGPEGRKPEGRCRPRSCVAKQGLERYGDCNSPGSGAPNRATLFTRIGKGRGLPGREGGRVGYLGGYPTARKICA